MDIPQDFLSLFYKEEKRFLIDSLLIKKTKFIHKLRLYLLTRFSQRTKKS